MFVIFIWACRLLKIYIAVFNYLCRIFSEDLPLSDSKAFLEHSFIPYLSKKNHRRHFKFAETSF